MKTKTTTTGMSGAEFRAIGIELCGQANKRGVLIERGGKSWQGAYAVALGVTREWVRRCCQMYEVPKETAERAGQVLTHGPAKRRIRRQFPRVAVAPTAARR